MLKTAAGHETSLIVPAFGAFFSSWHLSQACAELTPQLVISLTTASIGMQVVPSDMHEYTLQVEPSTTGVGKAWRVAKGRAKDQAAVRWQRLNGHLSDATQEPPLGPYKDEGSPDSSESRPSGETEARLAVSEGEKDFRLAHQENLVNEGHVRPAASR